MQKIVTVIGIGRVGLPLALLISSKGYTVYGIGRDEKKIELLKKGIMPFKEEGGNLLKKNINKTFIPTTNYELAKNSNIIILTLGTPIDENMNPVFGQIDSAINKLIPFLQKKQLIILRSTVSPQTTEYVKEKIEMSTKLKVGYDIFLSYCPERIAQGKAITETKSIPQIIGGVNEISSQKSKIFFESIGIKCLLTDDVSAELAKLFTNMYRYISFAISNEFMVIAENYNKNIHEIINLINQDYKRGGLALPGLTAGPCLFKDGFFLINDNPYLDLITASWKINESLPLFLIKKMKEKTPLKGKRVLILGVAFKPQIDDIRESLSFKLRKALLREHAEVILHDPFVKNYHSQEVLKNLDDALTNVDMVFVATRHNVYSREKKKIISKLSKEAYICDVWNVFDFNKLVFKAREIKSKKVKGKLLKTPINHAKRKTVGIRTTSSNLTHIN